MLRALLNPSPLSVCVLGIGGSILGLIGLLQKPTGRPGYATAAGHLVALGCVSALALTGFAEEVWWPALGLLMISSLFSLSRSESCQRVGKKCVRFALDRRTQWGCLTLSAPCFMVLFTAYGLPADIPIVDPSMCRDSRLQAHVSEEPIAWALTDAGKRIPLHSATWAYESHFNDADEEEYLGRQHLTLAAIRTGECGTETNCHGWVFTGGRYWLLGKYVDTILNENNYFAVFRPRPGDVAIFRDVEGTISHSAVVRSTTGGSIVLESKWGGMGRFLHTVEHHPYSESKCVYYRSSRHGHVLKEFGVEVAAAE